MKKVVLPIGVLCLAWLLSLSVPAPAQEPDTASLVRRACSAECHGMARVCRNLAGKGPGQWREIVARMVRKGAKVDPAHQEAVAALLADPRGAASLCPGQARGREPSFLEKAAANPLLAGHPAAMAATLLLALYVLYTGSLRFRSAHLKHKTLFPWKRHVRLGYAVMALWLLGLGSGMGAAWAESGGVGGSGPHFATALFMLPLMAFGAAGGMAMDRRKGRRKLLPLAHGACNLLLVLMAVFQASTGVVMLLRSAGL